MRTEAEIGEELAKLKDILRQRMGNVNDREIPLEDRKHSLEGAIEMHIKIESLNWVLGKDWLS